MIDLFTHFASSKSFAVCTVATAIFCKFCCIFATCKSAFFWEAFSWTQISFSILAVTRSVQLAGVLYLPKKFIFSGEFLSPTFICQLRFNILVGGFIVVQRLSKFFQENLIRFVIVWVGDLLGWLGEP